MNGTGRIGDEYELFFRIHRHYFPTDVLSLLIESRRLANGDSGEGRSPQIRGVGASGGVGDGDRRGGVPRRRETSARYELLMQPTLEAIFQNLFSRKSTCSLRKTNSGFLRIGVAKSTHLFPVGSCMHFPNCMLFQFRLFFGNFQGREKLF